jgi:putative pyruvate formate lyase activating enzyme
MARAYSAEAKSYPLVTKSALLEMNRQVGVARSERNGVIYRGLMIRHLVMPGEVSGSMDAMRWIAGSLPVDTYVNIMLQYRPTYRAHLYPEIDRPVSREDYTKVVEEARRSSLTNLDVDI